MNRRKSAEEEVYIDGLGHNAPIVDTIRARRVGEENIEPQL